METIAVIHPGLPIFSNNTADPSTNIAPKEMSKKSIRAPPRFIVTQNTRYMAARKIGIPRNLFNTILSILSVADFFGVPFFTADTITPWIKPYLASAIRISVSSPTLFSMEFLYLSILSASIFFPISSCSRRFVPPSNSLTANHRGLIFNLSASTFISGIISSIVSSISFS